MKQVVSISLAVVLVFSQSCIASCAPEHEGPCNDTSSSSTNHEYILPALIIVGLGVWYIVSNSKEHTMKEAQEYHRSDHLKFSSLIGPEAIDGGIALKLSHDF